MDIQYVQGKPLFNAIHKVKKQYEYLTEDVNTDIVIIGGGVTGSILGYYFTKAKIPAIILEKKRIAHASTGITTSLLQYELDSNARELEQYTSLDNVIQSYRLGIKALGEIDEFIKRNGNQCGYEKKDTLLYTSKENEIPEIEEEYRIRKEEGFDVTFLSQENHEFSFDLKAGVYSNNGGAQLDPYLFTHQLLESSCSHGLRVYENTEVTDISYLPDGVEVFTSYGHKVTAKKVILATGYDTKQFTDRNFGVKTVTYNIATKPVKQFEGWYQRVLIRDNQEPYHYYRTTEDNRIIAGGEDIPFVPGIFHEKQAYEKYQKLEQRIKEMFPYIKDIQLDYAYCGAFASTQDNLGFIGQDPKHKNFWYCLGYGANGILFSILGGMMLSKLYLGEKDENMKLFKVDRFDH